MKLDIGQDVLLELPERANLVGGLKIEHKFSQPDVHPYDLVEWERRNIAIFDYKKGVNAYERNNVEVPKFWDQNAAQTTVSKYLFGNSPDTPEYEDSLKNAFDRISNTYTVWGWKHGYFLDTDSAKAFNWELKAMLVNQMWAPNSPVWFNIGHWEQWRWGRPDLRQKLGGNKSFKAVLKEDGELEVRELTNAFNHPQASACFLTGVEDSMESILQHQVAEGRIFTSGSGVGINLSTLRSSHEPIAGKGKSSGPLSFDKGWDKMAGAIKSGGKTRRAARMVLMDSNHPDIMEFVNLKNEQEQIAKIVLREHNTQVALSGVAKDKLENGTVAEKLAAQFILSQPMINRHEYSGAMDGEVYGDTISNQNANHSVSLLGDFWDAYANNGNYSTRWVTQPDKIAATFKAEELLQAMAKSVYDNAEPGCHNNDWINLWSPYKSEERLTTSNPCITGDSLVAGQGLTPIVDLVGTTPRVKGLDGKLHKSVKVFKTGTKPVYRLTTKFGFHLDITSDHKVPVIAFETVGGEKVLRPHLDIPVSKIRQGDFVHLQGANPGTKKVRSELARLTGFAAACGSVLPGGALVLSFASAHEAAKEAHKIVKQLTGSSPTLVKLANKISLVIEDRKLLKQLSALLTLNHGAAAQLNNSALNLNTRGLGDLISAIFDASADIEKDKIVLKSKRAALLTQVQVLLLGFGIKGKLRGSRLELRQNNSYLFSRTIRFDAPSKRKVANKLKPTNLIAASINQKLDDLPHLDMVESIALLGEQDVYDLTEPVTSHFTANGIVIHNCSEYLAPINTSCNLSSFNAYRFLDRETKEIKTDLLEHGALLAMMVADLNVEEGGFPIPEIARATYQYRTTGIGFGNIGGLLMSLGIPYDSDEGRWLAGTLTSFLTASCWKASYKMGNEYGAYLKYETNKNDLTKVLDLHVASDSLLSKLPHINKEKAEEIISRGPNSTLPSWGSLTGRGALRALVESFDLATPWDEVMIKTTRKLSASTTNLWRDVKKEMKSGQPRNSFVSLYAPGGCLAADSMVLTSRGLKRLYRLGNPQGGQWQPINESVQTDEGPQQATKFYLNGRAPTRIVRTTRLHEIQGTGNHRVKRLNPDTLQLEWVHLKDATSGQILATRLGGMFGEKQTVWLPKLPTLHNNNKDGVHVPETMTKELAEFIGLFSGDGSLHSRSVRIACALRDKDLIKYILDLGQRLFGIKGKVNPKKEGQQSVSVDFYSQPLSAWMAACGFQKHPNREGKKSKKPFIPDLVLDTNDPYVYGAYLRGLAEADGTLKYNGLPTIATHHRPFAQDIMNLMTVLGIAAAMDDCTTSGHSGKTLYRVRLRNHDYLPAWEKYVGFLSNRKKDLQDNQVDRSFSRNDLIPINPNWLTKATQAVRNTSRLGQGIRKGQITKNTAKQIIKLEGNSVLGKRLKALLDYTFDAVLENLDGGVTNTYDLSVPSNVTYLANGFVSHNTISAPLGIYDEGTTSAEPDYTLVKYKVLAGGGMLRMFNRLALEGLRTIGYSEWHVKEAAFEVAGLNGLYVACQADADAVTRHLVMPTMDKPGPVREAYSQLDPNSPSYLEPSEMVRRVASGKSEGIADLILNGKGHVENIPWLPTHHMAIFDCAATSTDGKRAIEPLGHINMLGALQPFISGAVSKTVNLPYYATTDEILNCFVKSHKMGVKCIALYRADSKGVSVYQSSSPESQRWTTDQVWKTITSSIQEQADEIVQKASVPKRRKLHDRRWSQVVKFGIAGQGNLEGYLIVGVYPDGTCGEVFGKLGQGGSFAHGMFESFCKAFSVMLQWGVPFQQATSTFRSMAFDPSGFVKVGDPDSEHGRADIKSCKSVIDLVMQILKWMFPEENKFRIRELESSKLELGTATIEISEATEITANPGKSKSNQPVDLSSAETCPECGSLSVIQDGRCRKCTHCGYSSGGCGG